ncbi:MAG: DUF883 family protein [Hyphomicrobiaceae bacterium]|nr:DUF883 family protein [Hyphomicrobiaceae bacterium]
MVSPTQFANEPSQAARAGDIGAGLEELREDLARLAEQVQTYVQDRAGDLRDSAIETAGDVEELIRENPLPAVGIALGVGFVLGVMVRGGRAPRWEGSRLPRRDIDRLASRLGEALEAAAPRVRLGTASDAGEAAFLERLAGALSALMESSRATAASVGTAGGRAARSVASMGERTARSIADRLSSAARG